MKIKTKVNSPEKLGKKDFKNKNKNKNQNQNENKVAAKNAGKLVNGGVLKAKNKTAKPKKLTKVDKKAIEAQSDGQAENISHEVDQLLKRLKKKHGIDTKTNDSNNVDESPKKKKKKNKNQNQNNEVKITKEKALKNKNKENKSKKQKLGNDVDDEPQINKAVKKENTVVASKDAVDGKKKKKNKKNKQAAQNVEGAGQLVKPLKVAIKKEDVVESNSEENEPNTSLNDSQTEAQKTEHRLKGAVPVYIGNLPVNIKRKRILKLFKNFGEILSIRFRTNDGRHIPSKKDIIKKSPFVIAFIYMKNIEEAKACLAANGEKIGENVITVDLDTQLEHKEHYKPKNTVFVGNLKYAVTEQTLRETFKCCGKINHVRVLQGEKGCKGTAFVSFETPEAAALAMDLDKTLVLDREVHIEPYRSEKARLKSEKKKKNLVSGAARRLEKKDKKGFQKSLKAKGAGKKEKPHKIGDKKEKKSKDFLGTKSGDMKKKLFKKKPKVTGMKLLAKKIAPKGQSEKAN